MAIVRTSSLREQSTRCSPRWGSAARPLPHRAHQFADLATHIDGDLLCRDSDLTTLRIAALLHDMGELAASDGPRLQSRSVLAARSHGVCGVADRGRFKVDGVEAVGPRRD